MPIFYYLTGLNPEPSRAFLFWLIYVVLNLFVVSFGQTIAAIAPTVRRASSSLSVSSYLTPLAFHLVDWSCGNDQSFPVRDYGALLRRNNCLPIHADLLKILDVLD